jgi:hypothetical protein
MPFPVEMLRFFEKAVGGIPSQDRGDHDRLPGNSVES